MYNVYFEEIESAITRKVPNKMEYYVLSHSLMILAFLAIRLLFYQHKPFIHFMSIKAG